MTVYEPDEWTVDGRKIASPEQLARIAATVERTVLIVEHWHYRGSRSPTRSFFEDNDEWLAYLNENARPGDRFLVWAFEDVCRSDNSTADGKYPDDKGRVPRRGAY